jgi:hypothetical protein
MLSDDEIEKMPVVYTEEEIKKNVKIFEAHINKDERSFIERIHPIWRWVLFIPVFLLLKLLMDYVSIFSLNFMFTQDDSVFYSYIIYHFQTDFICLAISFYVSCIVAPRGRIIIASIYLGISVLFLGYTLALVIQNGLISMPIWKFVFGIACMIGAGIFNLIYVLKLTKKSPEDDRSV